LVILGIGFIQIESVKSVVKNQRLGLVAAPPRQVKQSEFASIRACQPKPWRRLVIRGQRLDHGLARAPFRGKGFSTCSYATASGCSDWSQGCTLPENLSEVFMP
jgi:hypothetical protein